MVKPLPVQLAVAKGLKGDASHVQAHRGERKVLPVIRRHPVDVAGQREEMRAVRQVQKLQKAQHSHAAQIRPRVRALRRALIIKVIQNYNSVNTTASPHPTTHLSEIRLNITL